MHLKSYVVTVRRFDPNSDASDDVFDLPVDSPNAEHAVSAALSNAVAFTAKIDGDAVLPVAFQATGVRAR